MSNNLTSSGVFNIVSLISGNPLIGAYYGSAISGVAIDGPITNWNITSEVNNTLYQFGVGGYPFTGFIGNDIIATVIPDENRKWYPVYHQEVDAYTIRPIDQISDGWTVTFDNPNSTIVLEGINSTFPPTQLFRFWSAGL